MDKLVFSCNWGNIPENAWSGTSMGLYRELLKYYEIDRLDINPRTPALLPLRCMEKLGIGRFDICYMKYFSKVFEKRYRQERKCKVFQFDECPDAPWADSYVYQDLCVGFLLDVYENRPELIPYCGLENLSIGYLRKREKIQSNFYQRAKGIFTMGQWLADYLVENCGIPREKVHAVGGGINVDATLSGEVKRTGNKILYIGRDFQRKGGDLVVKAFRILKKECPETELYIAGPAKNPLSKEEEADGIYFLGEQSRAQLNELYSRCDVFCMPSRFEAYGLVFAEALAFGLPCIARNAFAMKEFIRDGRNGYLIDNDDERKLADKMKLALKNETMKQYVYEQREWYLKEYSWESVVKRIVEVMKSE